MVRSNGFSGFDEWVFRVRSNGFSWSWVFWVKRSWFLGLSESKSVSGFTFSLLSLSLSLCASEFGNTLK